MPVSPHQALLRKKVADLRERFPPLFPVRVYLRSAEAMKDCYGDCDLIRKKGQPSHFRIRIRDGMSWDLIYSTLQHEWAHTIAWVEGHEDVTDHGPEWGLAYARIYTELNDE